jgi:hypothetical protein
MWWPRLGFLLRGHGGGHESSRETAKDAAVSLGAAWLRYKIALFVFVAILAVGAIINRAHAGDHVGYNAPIGALPANACGPWGTVTSAWLANNDGPYAIYAVTCSNAPGMQLMVPGR